GTVWTESRGWGRRPPQRKRAPLNRIASASRTSSISWSLSVGLSRRARKAAPLTAAHTRTMGGRRRQEPSSPPPIARRPRASYSGRMGRLVVLLVPFPALGLVPPAGGIPPAARSLRPRLLPPPSSLP